jgi:hypothetical protein
MGHLLSSAIKMQGGGAPATATLQYELFASMFSGTFTIYINGGVYQTMTTDTSLVSVTINAGDTFYATVTCSNGATIDYFLNGTYSTSFYYGGSGAPTETTTLTAVATNTYKYQCWFGLL